MSDGSNNSVSEEQQPDAAKFDGNSVAEQVVVLLQGSNIFGDQVYSYVQLTIDKLREMTQKMSANQNFKPSDFGRVVAAGRGEPPEELREEMAREHDLVDVPNAREAYDAAVNSSSDMSFPTFMDDDDEAQT